MDASVRATTAAPGAALGAARHAGGVAATMGALGVVYGDIGTSPLYAFKEAVKAAGGAHAPGAVTGVLSLIVWALVLVVSLKYAVLIMRAENRGEGGIVALLALLNARDAKPGTWRASLLVLGLIGAALLYGDGAITPAISVLSAVEGLKVDAPALTPLVVPITVAILLVLFAVQYKGTGFVGFVFAPVMLAWFVAIGALGVLGIAQAPGVLAALSPLPALAFLHDGPLSVSFAVLGAVFLAVTGGEAMYADMGHFGARPIRVAWFAVALPALLLNYFGQGALLLTDPEAAENPFFQLCPDWLHYPLVAFACAATVIASQAIISGAFSLTQQAIQLGFLPRLHVRQTASRERGQIYVPIVNWTLMLATLAAVLTFGSSDALAGAYGIAVSALMAITTVLAALVALQWGFNPLAVAAVNGFFLVIDLVFFAANARKLFEGGWFPLVLAALVAFLMLTWRTGTRLLERARGRLRPDEAAFLAEIEGQPPIRIPGTAAFLTASVTGIPVGLAHHLKHNRVLHERVLLVSVLTSEEPRIHADDRVATVRVSDDIDRVLLTYGFMQTPDVPAALKLAVEQGALPGVDAEGLTYYLGRETVLADRTTPGMATWREALFAALHRNAERSAAYFCVPGRQVVEIGVEIDI